VLTELEFPDLPVLSRQELGAHLEVKTDGVVELETVAARPPADFRSLRHVGEIDGGGKGAPEPETIAITVYINNKLPVRRSRADDQSIEETLSMMQDGLFDELGIILPAVRIETDSTLKADEFRFDLNGRAYSPLVGLAPDEFLVNDTADHLSQLKIEGHKAINPANGSVCTIVREDQGSSDACRQAGLMTWGPVGFLVLTLAHEIRKVAASFQTVEATEYVLDSLGAFFPQLIDTARKRFSVEEISLLLRDLLEEEISIRDARSILESMLSINGTIDVDLNRFIVFTPATQRLCYGRHDLDGLTTSDYSNFVRASLKRYISHKYTRGSNTLVVYLLDSAIEQRIGDAGTRPLTSQEQALFKAALRDEVEKLPTTAQNPVLLTVMDIRKQVRKLIEPDFPDLAVLTYQELSPDMNIQPIARISLAS
jgi:type III secretion protein V